MSAEENKSRSRRWFEEGYGRGNTGAMEELMPLQMLEEASLREQILAYREAFPDLQVRVEEQLAEADRVMTRVTFKGTNSGNLLGVPPTGKPIDMALVELHTWKDGQIADVWNDFHPVRILQQLGLLVEKA